MSEKEIVISVKELVKVFRDFWQRPKVKALQGISFEVRKSEIFGFLGPNGSGKSTTIKLILGLLYPTRGEVTVLNCSPKNVKIKKKIGFLPEETYLYPYLNAEETLGFFGSLFNLSSSQIKTKTKELLEMVGLSEVRKRKVGDFSKGMKRRLGLAQALINEPELLILDEPTSGLDPLGCRETKDLILNLAKRGVTVFMSSHLLADVEDICDRISIIYQGKMQALGEIETMLSVENINRISFPLISQESMNELIRVIKQEVKEQDIIIDKPSKNLEKFFLEVVEKAKITSV